LQAISPAPADNKLNRLQAGSYLAARWSHLERKLESASDSGLSTAAFLLRRGGRQGAVQGVREFVGGEGLGQQAGVA